MQISCPSEAWFYINSYYYEGTHEGSGEGQGDGHEKLPKQHFQQLKVCLFCVFQAYHDLLEKHWQAQWQLKEEDDCESTEAVVELYKVPPLVIYVIH